MLKTNKPKNPFRLPKIPMPFDSQQLGLVQQQVRIICSKRSRSYKKGSKQNNYVRDLKGNTVYLEFPIRKKKLLVDNSPELKVQKLEDSTIFASRALCSNIRQNVRAKMYKYDEQRTQVLTERVQDYLEDPEHLVLKQLLNKQAKRSIEPKKSTISNISNLIPQKSKIKSRLTVFQLYGANENVTRWDNYGISSRQKQSDDTVLQQLVQHYKKSRQF